MLQDPPQISQHAHERWAYRFSGFELYEELKTAREIPASRILKSKVFLGHHREGHTYLLAKRSSAVFVVSPDGCVITVIRLIEDRYPERNGGHKARLQKGRRRR